MSSKEDQSSRKRFAEQLAKEHFERLSRITGHADDGRREKSYASKTSDEHKKAKKAKKDKDAKDGKDSSSARKQELLEWDEEYMGYTNTDNPFGDANLLKTFVWTKKYEKLGIKDIDPEEIEKQNRIKLEENKRELEKVKQRRLQREREREARLEELAKAQREKEALQFKEWEKQEDTFHLKQAKLRSQLRIKEGRAKPIDLLARYIDIVRGHEEKKQNQDDDSSFELVEPYLCLNGLRIADIEDLQEDIKVYMELDKKSNADYWNDLQTIVEDELQKLRKIKSGSDSGVERREGINAAVSSEVTAVFKGKTPAQLNALQTEIEKKIRSGEEGIDISYWETLLSKLKAFMARARLKEQHEEYTKKQLSKLKQKNNENEKQNLFPVVKKENVIETGEEKQPIASSSGINKPKDNELLEKCKNDYESGRYSPTLIPFNQVETGIIVIDPEDDMRKLIALRKEILGLSQDEQKPLSEAEIAFERFARRGMTDDDIAFNGEERIKQDKSVAAWSDKYRPRKPRYFNRVHTGFEWNKYNQTHYDVDNPPPKIVQGYKFNIFYPDLIDKHKTPTYTVTPCADNRDFAIIRFSAGPPYEDIAFKIVNREWNYSYKSGFRCQFHNNILQLWFHFKRYRYRR
ncbi:cactin-like isoform X2 [Dinothrombium tinctorium]|uniref:Splicing factor Cactin n=1 Tax=Dinothrombium tinctorium TaxID=1965070 RepID=A0A3S3PJJ3_9ACAR|nr:cactin-like isoform X2 [Dinothrombium tinctorium]RWS13781.1 cactin-like isoform X2 [Dinothrombium tinctorium]